MPTYDERMAKLRREAQADAEREIGGTFTPPPGMSDVEREEWERSLKQQFKAKPSLQRPQTGLVLSQEAEDALAARKAQE